MERCFKKVCTKTVICDVEVREDESSISPRMLDLGACEDHQIQLVRFAATIAGILTVSMCKWLVLDPSEIDRLITPEPSQ